jgi:putative FmdB family regulatory protein
MLRRDFPARVIWRMPTYEYECTKGCRFEIEQSIKDDPLKRCPKAACPRGVGGVSVRRLISAANFILKGGGWYSDGYSGKGGSKKESGASDSGGSAKSGDSGGKSESGSKSDSGSKPDSGSKSGSSAAPASD